MSDPKDYTVGWICAINTEYVAAQAFFDEKHEGPEYVSPNDNNDYTLGKFGKHNVVIAVLPDGEYGTSSAASVARDMLHSFPSVRIGLMVGIGGGAPSRKHDIRLGDIVVSAPRDGNGGVFQYDFGKTIQDQSFRTTGFLNQPPMVLRTAVSGLKAQYESEGHQLEEVTNSILEKKPRLRKKYRRPAQSSDRLYQTGVVHPNDESNCTAACGDDPSNLICRPNRIEEEDNPVIHYGLIASANQLMKDAVIRDKLAAEKDVLCFEMEAAGLMNHFQCLVIRGICDYSDSHKNKEWQGYAAMMAAAYAKDLLCRIPPNKVEAEKRIGDILSGVQESVDKLVRKQHDHEHDTILNWLSPIDHDSQQRNIIRGRQEGTGEWLLKSNEFEKWINHRGQTLFCPGIPGAGKTMMSAIVVEHLSARFGNDSDVGIAYIYCSYQPQQEQEPVDLLQSLLKQLAQQRPTVPTDVENLHYKTKATRPSFDEVVKVLHLIIQLYTRVFIVIDALDEYHDSSDEGLKRLLSAVFSLQDKAPLNLFATSRFVSEITSQFEGYIRKEIRAQVDDLLRYVSGRIPQLLRSRISNHPYIEPTIREDVVKAAEGMFLLARLHMDFLMSQPTLGHVKRALQNLPKGIKGLDDTYEQAMRRIQGQEKEYRALANRVLTWVTHAKRALSTAEIQHALAVTEGTTELDTDFLPEAEVLDSVCAGLITVDESSDIVRLVHYTTQEYFERTSSFPNAEREMTTTCVTYLSFRNFADGFCATDEEFVERLRSNILYDYAAKNWGHHARGNSIEREQLMMDFLENGGQVAASSQAMIFSRGYHYGELVTQQVQGVHLAAYFGLKESMEALLGNGYDPDPMDFSQRTPLSWAAQEGHEAVVELLVATDRVDVNSKDSDERTPLAWAAQEGQEAVVELLVATDRVDVNSKDSNGQTPLSWAARKGHEAVVKLLLAIERVDVNSKDSDGRTPLSWAAQERREAVVKLLVATERVDVDLKDSDGRTPLSWAARKGHETVVELLVATDRVDVDLKDSDGRTPLSWAARKGHEAVIKLLLATERVDVDLNDSNRRTPLSWAARKGHETVVELLVATDRVNVNTEDFWVRTPLSLAAQMGHEAVVELLVTKDQVDVDSKDSFQRTPLSWAAQMGHEAVVKLLVATGRVDVDLKDSDGWTPLSWAAQEGHEAVVKLLVATERVDVDSKDSYGRTPLYWAAWKRHEAVIKLLLATGRVDVNSKDSYRRTPLMWAVRKGHEAVIKLLLATERVDVDLKDFKRRTPLLWAAQEGQKAVVELLMATDRVDVNSKDSYERTPLSLAAQMGHEAVVELLVTKDQVDVDLKDSFQRTPLSWAAQMGHEAVVKLLVATGRVDVDLKDSYKRTPLSWVAQMGHEAVFKLLVATERVDVDSKDSDRRTPLSWAAQEGHKAVVKLLVATERVDVDFKDSDGWTPLSWAAQQGHEAVVKLLVATERVDVDSKDSDGRTPLSWAAAYGHEAVVKLLMATERVDVDSKDSDGRTPLLWAAEFGHEAVVKLLVNSAVVNIEDNYGWTPLQLAALNVHMAVERLLIAKGEPEPEDIYGFQALFLQDN